jgi:hypothetical protein
MTVFDVSVARARIPLKRLAHFTPAHNLWHIISDGEIRSSKDLADNAPDYFSPTDIERFDQHPEMVCCSFEYPNAYYLFHARRKASFINYPDWVCLLLDVNLIERRGTLFSSCNAAKGRGGYLSVGGQALLDCYATVTTPGGFERGPNHTPAAATDLQAEALVPGPIPVSAIRGIVAPSAADAQQLYGVLERHGRGPERFRWLVVPTFFDRNLLSSRLRSGMTIDEIEWNPPSAWEDS